MSKPVVAVVGRPNVGKSTLFNKLVGQRISIVEDTPGVTRDRIYAEAEWCGTTFALIDTGGIEPSNTEVIPRQMRQQAEIAMETADVILFMVDGRDGLTNADIEVGEMLRPRSSKVVLAVNKVDGRDLPEDFYDFYTLGLGDPVAISAANMLGLGDLLDELVANFPKNDAEEDEETINIAVIGKPNVGKSSLINALLGEERVIVSDIAGTTRDSIDTPLEKDGEKYILVDTAGIRRKNKIYEDIERYSVIRAIAAIERSDVCVIMIDATEGFTEQDSKVAGLAHEAGKACIIAVNKWDAIEKDGTTMNSYKKDLEKDFAFMSYAPMIFISAKTGQRLDKLFEMIKAVANANSMRIKTGTLNDVLAQATARVQPPTDKGRRLKIFYMTQASTKPPTFVCFVNSAQLFHFSYQRYLENRIRDTFGLEGTPIRFVIRERGDK